MDRVEGDPPRADLIAGLAALPGAAPVEQRADGLWIVAPRLDVKAMAREMKALGARLVTMTGLPLEHGEATIIYHYALGREIINFKTATKSCEIASITESARAASWIEREIHDFFAVKFIGHPNLVPLLRPPALREGFFRDPEPTPAAPQT